MKKKPKLCILSPEGMFSRNQGQDRTPQKPLGLMI